MDALQCSLWVKKNLTCTDWQRKTFWVVRQGHQLDAWNLSNYFRVDHGLPCVWSKFWLFRIRSQNFKNVSTTKLRNVWWRSNKRTRFKMSLKQNWKSPETFKSERDKNEKNISQSRFLVAMKGCKNRVKRFFLITDETSALSNLNT